MLLGSAEILAAAHIDVRERQRRLSRCRGWCADQRAHGAIAESAEGHRAFGSAFEHVGRKIFGQAQNAKAGTQGFFRVSAPLHLLCEHFHGRRADRDSALYQLLVGQVDHGAVPLRPMRSVRAEMTALSAAHVRSDESLAVENLDAARRESDVDGLADELVWHGIERALDLDVIIQVYFGLLPGRELVWLCRQRPQRRTLGALE